MTVAADSAAAPRALRVAAAISWRFLAVAAATGVVLYLATRLRLVVIPVIVALLLAAVLESAVAWLAAHRIPRAASALTLVAVVAGVAATLALVLGPRAAREIASFDASAPPRVADIESWATDAGLPAEAVARALDRAEDEVRANAGAIAAGALSGAYAAVEIVAAAVLTVVITFFFVKDGPALWAAFVARLPARRRDAAREVGSRAHDALASYVRATAVVATVDAVGIAIALLVMDVPLVIPLALLTFVGGFFPFVGAFVAGAAAVVVALVAEGPLAAVVVAAAVVAVQQLEGNVLQPLIVGRSVALHPLVVLLAVTVGALVWGIAGAFVAVPVVAVAVKSLDYFRDAADGHSGATRSDVA